MNNTQTQMRRWILKAGTTDLSGLTLVTATLPQPGPGEVRLRVHAASLNARDQMVLKGVFGRLPGRDLVPLADGAGEIDALGPGVRTWEIGDRVTGLFCRDWTDGPPGPNIGRGLGADDEDGMLAEYVVLPAGRVSRAATSLDFAQAATLPCAALTAWNALYGDHPIGPGGKVLVLGTGGVSLFALILARAAGAQVWATTSQADKRERLCGLGATDVINYRSTPEWGRAIFEMTGGVDKVVDSAGTFHQALAALAPGGEVALMGVMDSDGAPDPGLLMGKGATIRGISVGNTREYEALVRAIDAHGIKPPIDRRFRFEDAKDAYSAQSSPGLFGKIVIDVA